VAGGVGALCRVPGVAHRRNLERRDADLRAHRAEDAVALDDVAARRGGRPEVDVEAVDDHGADRVAGQFLDNLEAIDARALGGADNLTVGNLSGTDVTRVDWDLRGPSGADDAAADNVVVDGTPGDDVEVVSAAGPNAQVNGLQAVVQVTGAGIATDRLTVKGLAGNDVLDATSAAGSLPLTLDGGDGDDFLVGDASRNVLLGGPGQDVINGVPSA
jgi:Ca2+-binding RTX toxin-like protein